METTLPSTAQEFMSLEWDAIAPHYRELESAELNQANVGQWLSRWSRLAEMVRETEQRLFVATSVNTADKEAEARLNAYLDGVYQEAQKADQRLKEKLLASGLEPEGFDVPLRNMRAEAELYREVNVPLLAQEMKLSQEYDQIVGAQTVVWEGEEIPVARLNPVLEETDRTRREKAWRMMVGRKLEDRERLNELWNSFYELRGKIARNAGCDSFRTYKWRELFRFDYSPEECKQFHAAIERQVVPAASRIYARQREALGVEALRPWDLDVDPSGKAPLHPFENVERLVERSQGVLAKVDPELGGQFRQMADEGLLDLDSRKNKAPGGYCTNFDVVRKPFIFMNASGVHDDVQTLLHEAGHAFHVFATAHLPYVHQLAYTSEIAEVASMSMELLSGRYLSDPETGFYSEAEAARARIKHLEGVIQFWPYMAVVDAFQHWAYETPAQACDPEAIEAKWTELWNRFMPGVDWTGLELERAMGWQRKLHIFVVPMYYVEYGMASLGALQVWRNSLTDPAGAVQAYRRMLALGGTRPLPELFEAAGAKFAFDDETLGEAVGLVEQKLQELRPIAS
ncbi:MAG: M3 family oligoendopeptidase [Fimbriimonadaceae bacterium]|nr:M3 family oligoendopeptidase [Chthonomonadaceae bacterium]MCO5296052.1 M3 family oligoendopeptidase [Fimbriimonadaceae bacterium]